MESKKIEIVDNTSLFLEEDGIYRINLSLTEKLEVEIESKENSKIIALIQYSDKAGTVKISTKVGKDSNLTVLYWNGSNQTIKVEEAVSIFRNGIYKVAYGELSDGIIEREANYYLLEPGSELEVSSATICQSKKHFYQTAHHVVGDTKVNLENYGIALKHADYYLRVIGKIEKGSKKSESYQTSRVLTFDEDQKTVVLPELLIDENDVKASHAMTIGQMDENQMYYLQSRGLSENEAMQLVTLGYLQPIAQIIDDETIREELLKQIEEKVNTTCWI